MLRLKFLIFFIIFIQAAPTILDHYLNGQLSELDASKCLSQNRTKKETTAECIAKSSLIQPKGEYDPRCCKITFISDPVAFLKEKYKENWKKIISQQNGYDLNISEEELRKKLGLNAQENSQCQFTNNIVLKPQLYMASLFSLDGVIKYDCGEGEKKFNKKDYHPTNKDEIIDKEMIDFSLEKTEKNCLKKGQKFSDDDYQMCWCEKIPLSATDSRDKGCIPFKISTFEDRLKKEMNISKKGNMKIEYKCTCLNNKGKTMKGRYNSLTGEVKVE